MPGSRLPASAHSIPLSVVLLVCSLAVQGAEGIGRGADPAAGLYAANCAQCHDVPEMKLPDLAALKSMDRFYLQEVLTNGRMAPQAYRMKIDDLMALLNWLTKDQPPRENWVDASLCEDRTPHLRSGDLIGDWGHGKPNHRARSAEAGGVTSANVASLTLEWTLAFPRTAQMRSQPALAGDTLFLAVADAMRVFALDAYTGCVKWEYQTAAPPRTAVGYAVEDGRDILWFGDAAGNAYVLDAVRGTEIWRRDVRIGAQSMITGAPVLHEGILYIPLSLYEIFSAMHPEYECCSAHGGMLAVEALTGKQVWLLETTEPARKTHHSPIGVQQWGPSGAPVWNSPAIDGKRGVLYFGTGENTSDPATETSDAIFAVDLQTGERRWLFQATARDTFNSSCRGWAGAPSGPNCPEEEGPDHDFGASVVLATLADGKDVVLAGQKSGTVWALDPDAGGKLLWSTSLSTGVPLNGGIHWGMAFDGERLYVPVSDMHPIPYDTPRPALNALDPATGEILWSTDIEPSCRFDPARAAAERARGERLSCHPFYGLSAPPTVAGDVVFVGGLDGMFRAFAAATGKVLWSHDTHIQVTGKNGVAGWGGAIDSNGTLVSNGRVYIQSGYAMHGQQPGNLLLMYRIQETP